MGTSPNPNGPKGGLPASTPRSSPQSPGGQTKRKQPGVMDMKAMELENEFKAKHLGVMGVVAWIL
jgi:phosphatidylinositol glycan class O